MREQRFVFGEVADQYDRCRPSFPDAMVADLVEMASLDASSTVVEIGPGTGKLTVLLAPTGCSILAVEPSAPMAEVLARNVAGFARVEIVSATFEAVEVEPGSIDLVVAAQSWHWVDGEAGVPHAASMLRAGGTIGLVWNVAIAERYEFHDEIDAVYRARAPHLAQASGQAGWQSNDDPTPSLEESADFTDVRVVHHPWSRTLTTAEYIDVLATHSHHRMLEPDVRSAVLGEIGAVVDGHGGEITEHYDARIFAATRV